MECLSRSVLRFRAVSARGKRKRKPPRTSAKPSGNAWKSALSRAYRSRSRRVKWKFPSDAACPGPPPTGSRARFRETWLAGRPAARKPHHSYQDRAYCNSLNSQPSHDCPRNASQPHRDGGDHRRRILAGFGVRISLKSAAFSLFLRKPANLKGAGPRHLLLAFP
jgi:hypothetical protein